MRPRVLLAALLVLPLLAADWPQWRGPNRDGVSKETGLLKTWPKEGPKLAWTYKKAGAGFSCPAVVGDRLYTMGARDGDEYLFCLDIKDPTSPAERWAVKVGPTFTFKGNIWGDGPRATPTVDNGLVYGLGGQGELVCVDANDGTLKWRKSMPKDLNGQVNPIGGGPENFGWGYAWSPLVNGDKLVCTPGGPDGTVAALDKKTGNVLWRSKDLKEQCAYSSPILAEVGGIRHYVIQTYKGPYGVSADGVVLWHYERPYKDVLIPTPLFHDGYVFVTSGHGPGYGCDLVKLTADGGKITAKKVYSNTDVNNQQGGVVFVGGHIYGHCHTNDRGTWICQDFLKGTLLWSEKDALGPGSIIAADGCLYCFGDEYEPESNEGTVVLIEASSKEWTEKGRFALPEKSALLKKPSHKNSKRWTPPVIANGKLYLRDQELIFCYEIK